MSRLELTLRGHSFAARLLRDRSPALAERLERALPLSVHVLQDQWSGAFVRSAETVLSGQGVPGDEPEPYQTAGRVYLDPRTMTLAVCYGRGRLQDAYSAAPAIPLAEVLERDDFVDVCRSIQFSGASVLTMAAAPGGIQVGADPAGPRFQVRLGQSVARAVLLREGRTALCDRFLSMLPLAGIATNTHSSGPLVRFWNETGGPEGETPLDPTDDELRRAEAVLEPGYLYYMPKRGFRGIRIPFRDATMMRSAITGGGSELVPIARFVGDWAPFRQAAARLRWDGALPLSFTADAATDAVADPGAARP